MKKLITFFLFLLFVQFSFSQITNTDVVAKLNVETTDNVSSIIAKASNTTEVYFSLKYIFSVITYNPDNTTSKESQEDLFTLDPVETKDLINYSLSTENGNKIIVLILIYDEDEVLIAKDRFVFNEEKKDETENTVETRPNDGLELLGIVADETKTKFGKDFYDFFYFYYTYNNIKGESVVKIEEQRSFRRNTKVKISIDEDVIFEFYTRPNNEYLESMSKVAVQKIYKYFQNKKKEKTYITQY